MANLLYTYALVKSLYDREEDYIDSFWPFVVQALEIGKYSNTKDISNKIFEATELSIPLHVLGTILRRARKNGYLDYRLESREDIKHELKRVWGYNNGK